MSIGNQAYKSIDFDFVELRFASVLRLPRPHGLLPAGRGAKNRTPPAVELGAAKINLL